MLQEIKRRSGPLLKRPAAPRLDLAKNLLKSSEMAPLTPSNPPYAPKILYSPHLPKKKKRRGDPTWSSSPKRRRISGSDIYSLSQVRKYVYRMNGPCFFLVMLLGTRNPKINVFTSGSQGIRNPHVTYHCLCLLLEPVRKLRRLDVDHGP